MGYSGTGKIVYCPINCPEIASANGKRNGVNRLAVGQKGNQVAK